MDHILGGFGGSNFFDFCLGRTIEAPEPIVKNTIFYIKFLDPSLWKLTINFFNREKALVSILDQRLIRFKNFC